MTLTTEKNGNALTVRLSGELNTLTAQDLSALLDEELDDDLDNEFLPDGGHRLAGLMDDHGISRIARELTEAEQRVKDELDGIDEADRNWKSRRRPSRPFKWSAVRCSAISMNLSFVSVSGIFCSIQAVLRRCGQNMQRSCSTLWSA